MEADRGQRTIGLSASTWQYIGDPRNKPNLWWDLVSQQYLAADNCGGSDQDIVKWQWFLWQWQWFLWSWGVNKIEIKLCSVKFPPKFDFIAVIKSVHFCFQGRGVWPQFFYTFSAFIALLCYKPMPVLSRHLSHPLAPVLGHVPRHVLRYVPGNMLEHLPKHVPDRHVLDRHLSEHVLGHVLGLNIFFQRKKSLSRFFKNV